MVSEQFQSNFGAVSEEFHDNLRAASELLQSGGEHELEGILHVSPRANVEQFQCDLGTV